MKQKDSIILVIASVVVFSFLLIPSISSASQYPNQLDSSASQNQNYFFTGCCGNVIVSQWVQEIENDTYTGIANYVDLKLGFNNAYIYGRPQLVVYTVSDINWTIPVSTYYLDCQDGGAFSVSWDTHCPTAVSTSTYRFYIYDTATSTTPVNLQFYDTYKYRLIFGDTGDTSRTLTHYGVATTTPLGTLYQYSTVNGGQYNYPTFNAYLNWGFDSNYSQSNLVFPYDGAVVSDFSNWVVELSGYNSSSYSGSEILISYWQSTSTPLYTDRLTFSESDSFGVVTVPKTHSLNPPFNLTATSTWYAQVSFDGVLTQGIISFTVNPQVQNNSSYSGLANQINNQLPYLSPSSTSPFECDNFVLDAAGCLANAGVYVLQWLFVPNSYSMSWFQGSLTMFKAQFPFNIVFDLANTAQGVMAQYVDTGSPLTFDLSGVGSNLGSMTVLTTSTFQNQVGTSTKAMYYEFFENIIWLGAGIGALVIILRGL